MSLLNLGTGKFFKIFIILFIKIENESLRLAAYNMLAALCNKFNFIVKLQLLGTDGKFSF